VSGLTGPTRILLLVLTAVLIGSAIRNIKEDGDFRGYIEAGELVLQGADIYAESRPDVNTWPPLYSVVCIPFALLARVSVYLARGVWLALNFACIVALFGLCVRLVYHAPLVLRARPDAIALASSAVVGPLVLSARFLLGNLDRLQINLVMLAACLLAGLWLTRGRQAAGGSLLGFAAAVKVLPVFFVPYLAWRRWWRAFAAAVTTGLAASLAPILVFGWGASSGTPATGSTSPREAGRCARAIRASTPWWTGSIPTTRSSGTRATSA
jgi:alpha-1,2-mannosyltransferase